MLWTQLDRGMRAGTPPAGWAGTSGGPHGSLGPRGGVTGDRGSAPSLQTGASLQTVRGVAVWRAEMAEMTGLQNVMFPPLCFPLPQYWVTLKI